MIFDDINQPAAPHNAPPRRRSHRRHRDSAHGRRRRRSTFERASKFSGRDALDRSDRSTKAWLSMLAVLVLAAGGFAFYLQHEKGRALLPGEAPSTLLLPFIDPILAPLETGNTGYDPEALRRVAVELQTAKSAANRDDEEVFAAGSTIATILQESVQDRGRHQQRLVDLGSPVIGMNEGGAPKNSGMTETQKQHLELAVGVSWQRNSVAYRNRVEELWYRLLRLEQGRFRGGSASSAMIPAMPTSSTNE